MTERSRRVLRDLVTYRTYYEEKVLYVGEFPRREINWAQYAVRWPRPPSEPHTVSESHEPLVDYHPPGCSNDYV